MPVVTTSANGAAEALTEPAAGTVVAPGDAGALAQALTEWIAALSDESARERTSAAARRATEGRSLDDWLDGLVSSILDAAQSG